MPHVRLICCLLLVALATGTVAQTEYETARRAAMQRLGSRLQVGDVDTARRDLTKYLARFPGDAVMHYNLACLDALVDEPDTALTRLATAFAAGYRDLKRPLVDPDLARLADDPRLTALLDSTRADLVTTMQSAALYLEESAWSERRPLRPDPLGPGADAPPGHVRLRYDTEALTVEIAPPPAGADEAIVTVSLPRNLDEHETARWFEFRTVMAEGATVDRIARHGAPAPMPRAGRITADEDVWLLQIPWSSLHPYRPPVELLVGFDVVLRRATGHAPADRWALVHDPHAGSGVVPWRRFAPLHLDPGPTPAPLVAGRLDSYLVVGDSLTVELGIQGLPDGDVTVRQLVGDRPDTAFTATLEPDLAYLTLDYHLPASPPTGWFELGAEVTAADGTVLAWRDRGFRLHPDWFLQQNERLAVVPLAERPIVQYQLFRTLRGQQDFQPHDDPSDLARAALTVGELLDRVQAHGTVLPPAAGVVPAAFPTGTDALQACQLVLPDAARRAQSSLVLVLVATREHGEVIGATLAARRPPTDARTYLVVPTPPAPGRSDEAIAAATDALTWGQSLSAAPAVAVAAAPGLAPVAMRMTHPDGPVPLFLLAVEPVPMASAAQPAHVTMAGNAGTSPVSWAAEILAWK